MRFTVLALLGLTVLDGAAHSKECSNAILHGSYGINATGIIIGAGPVGRWAS